MQASRREFLALSVLWTEALEAAQSHLHQVQSVPVAAYQFTFFTQAERSSLGSLAGILIPADERSGGAKAARVDEYIDFVLTQAAAPLQKRWRDGLKSFANISGEQMNARLAQLARNEFAPHSKDDEFFILLKSAVVEGFYTSEEGINKELRYAGLGSLREFPGCTHTSHERPQGYRPMLRDRA
jgi:hypothetical protein